MTSQHAISATATPFASLPALADWSIRPSTTSAVGSGITVGVRDESPDGDVRAVTRCFPADRDTPLSDGPEPEGFSPEFGSSCVGLKR